MKKTYTKEQLRQEITTILNQTIAIRRNSLIEDYADHYNHDPEVAEALRSVPLTPVEVDEFIIFCSFPKEEFNDILLLTNHNHTSATIELNDDEMTAFLESVTKRATSPYWLAGDDSPFVLDNGEVISSQVLVFQTVHQIYLEQLPEQQKQQREQQKRQEEQALVEKGLQQPPLWEKEFQQDHPD